MSLSKIIAWMMLSLFIFVPHLYAQNVESSVCSLSKEGCPTVTEDGITTVSYAYPSGDPENSVLLLEKSAPQEIAVGKQFEYTLSLTNMTPCAIEDLVVTETMADVFTLDKADPKPAAQEGTQVIWTFSTLPANEKKEITVSGKISKQGQIPYCTKITYNPLLCIIPTVVEPNLDMSVLVPGERSACQQFSVVIDVGNKGTGTINDLMIDIALPQGLQTAEEQNRVAFDVGTLGANENEVVTVDLHAIKTGKYSFDVVASAADDISTKINAGIFIWKPLLSIDASGEESLYLGRQAELFLRVENAGDGPAKDLTIQTDIPDCLEFVSANNDGAYYDSKIHWEIDSLAVSEFKTVSFRVQAKKIESAFIRSYTRAECAEQVAAVQKIEVKGIPAILLGLIDVSDPLEVGEEETYIITIVNQGSAPGTNVVIQAEFEENFEYVSSIGPTEAVVSGRKLIFEKLDVINPGDEISWMVNLKAMKPGDVRFHLNLKSDQLDRPVMETEATTIY